MHLGPLGKNRNMHVLKETAEAGVDWALGLMRPHVSFLWGPTNLSGPPTMLQPKFLPEKGERGLKVKYRGREGNYYLPFYIHHTSC